MEERFLPLKEWLLALSRQGTRVCAALDGCCAAGKTTLAGALAQEVPLAVVHMDDFFLPKELRTEARLSVPGGNVHYERVLQEVLEPFFRGERVEYGVFDCRVMAVTRRERLPEASVLLLEGAYSLHPALREHCALQAFLEVSPETQRARILRRNGPEGLRTFEQRWIPLENRYFHDCRVRQCCDLILQGEGEEHGA